MDAKQCDICKRLYVASVADDVERIEENGGRRATVKVEYANAYQTVRRFEWLDKCEVV